MKLLFTFISAILLAVASALPTNPSEVEIIPTKRDFTHPNMAIERDFGSPKTTTFDNGTVITHWLDERGALWHGQPFCNPTGEGVCNFAWFEYPDDFGGKHITAWVYNRFCRLIGNRLNAGTQFYLSSELPKEIYADTPNYLFCYAGHCYANKWGNCVRYPADPDSKSLVTQCAFECGGGSFDHP